MTKKVIVIGSGFGGLASALRLRAKGYEVTLLEKHPDLGGRARVFKKGNFVYDGGPTVITAPYLLEELFSIFNKTSSLGAHSRTRTGTSLRTRDFKSLASTYSAKWASHYNKY